MKKDNFINIPRNPKDLHSLKDLKKAYDSANEFISNLNEYFHTVVFSHFKTVDELLSEIPQNKWSDYIMDDYKPNNYRYEKSETLTLENFYNTFYKKFKEDEKHFTVIGFFIDHSK